MNPGVRIVGSKGARSKRILNYKILICEKLDKRLLLLQNSKLKDSIWLDTKDSALIYKVTTNKEGFIIITLGTGATLQMKNLQQVKNKAAKILEKLSSLVTSLPLDMVLFDFTNRAYLEGTIRGNIKAQARMLEFLESYNTICMQASEALYLAAMKVKTTKAELEILE